MEGEGGKKIVFIGGDRKTPIKIILMMKVEKYLKKGYEAYLNSVNENWKEGTKLKGLPVVNKFEDVFSDDLLGLPPKRENEFEIELKPRTAPIS